MSDPSGKNLKNTIAPFGVDSAVPTVQEPDSDDEKVVNLDFFADQNANEKSPIQAMVRYLSREASRHKLSYSQLKFIFRSVRERCSIPVEGNKSRKLYELPTAEELAAFYSVITDPVHRLIFETLETSGLRISELCNLEIKRIDFKTNLVFVSEGKGKKDRTTIFGTRVLEKIRLYLVGRNNRYLFESNRRRKYSRRRLEQICRQYRKAAGITKRLSPHTFRHLFFTRLAEAGVPKEKRMILAGHSSESVQDQYTHLGIGGIKTEVLAILERAGL